MVWVEFLFSAAVIVYAATQLAKHGDTIALRTGLGRLFIGLLLLAGATSLPELLTTISSLDQGVPDLAAGNLLGSNMFNMLLLAVLDMIHRRERILRKAALKHALSGSLTVTMIALVTFFILADFQAQIGWVGLDRLAILLVYSIALRLIQKNDAPPGNQPKPEPLPLPPGFPPLWQGILGFLLASAALVIVSPILVRASNQIAEITGLGASFIGTTLVATVTSLPELVTTIAAARLGADDMAIGNLFGSNMFNMAAIGLTDVFYTPGRFLGVIDPSFLVVAMLGLLMTSVALIGNLARIEKRLWIIEADALLIFLMYFGGIVMLAGA